MNIIQDPPDALKVQHVSIADSHSMCADLSGLSLRGVQTSDLNRDTMAVEVMSYDGAGVPRDVLRTTVVIAGNTNHKLHYRYQIIAYCSTCLV